MAALSVGLGSVSQPTDHTWWLVLVGRDSGTRCFGSDGVTIVAQLDYAYAVYALTC